MAEACEVAYSIVIFILLDAIITHDCPSIIKIESPKILVLYKEIS